MSLMPTPAEAALFVGGAFILGAAVFGIARALVKRRPEAS